MTKTMISAVTIVAHTKKEAPVRILPALVGWLEDRGVDVALPLSEAAEFGLEHLGRDQDSLFEGSGLVIVLGGDGTILRVARMLQRRLIPVFGVNLGNIGFLMRFTEDTLYVSLELVLAGNYLVEERTMLNVAIDYENGESVLKLVLNEALISGEEFNRLIRLDVSINDNLFGRFALDGMIVATPTGATAYSFSAGGPIVSPLAELLLLTPICPHSLFNRTLVLAADDSVTITPTSRSATERVRVSLDGVAEGGVIDKVTVTAAPEKFQFVTSDGPDFFANLRLKLRGWDNFTKD